MSNSPKQLKREQSSYISKSLSRRERENIIINSVKGKLTPGYEVSLMENGKYKITRKPIEIEEEEDSAEGAACYAGIKEYSEDEQQPEPIKQNINKTLKNIEFSDSDSVEEQIKQYQPNLKKYKRRKLKLI